MLVGKIITGSGTQRYDGFADEAATKKKIAYDVFQKGDSVFMTGIIGTTSEALFYKLGLLKQLINVAKLKNRMHCVLDQKHVTIVTSQVQPS